MNQFVPDWRRSAAREHERRILRRLFWANVMIWTVRTLTLLCLVWAGVTLWRWIGGQS